MDTIFTTENSQPTKTLADYINEGKSFLEAYQAQSPKRLARGKAYEQVEMLKELLNLLHQPDNTEVQQVTDVLIPKTRKAPCCRDMRELFNFALTHNTFSKSLL